MAVLSSGSAPRFVHVALAESPGPARLLGCFPTAGYLKLGSGAVIAVLTADAVQLPIGLTLPWSSTQLDLVALAAAGPAVAMPGGDCSELLLGGLRITVTGQRSAALRYCGRPPDPGRLAPPKPVGSPDLADFVELIGFPELGLPELAGSADAIANPFRDPVGAVDRLLGRGPGLTPAGDDLLCGALAATVLFGIPDSRLADAVLDRLAASGQATSCLSRQLLLRAVAGDGLPELQRLGAALCQPEPPATRSAWHRLLAIGHSSGAALGAGLLAGAEQAATAGTAAA